MALEHLLAALESEAQSRIRRELNAAHEEAHRLEAEAADRVARLHADAVHQKEAELRQDTERLVAAARRQAREKLLRARHQLLSQVLQRARELAADAARNPAYRDGLRDDLVDAMSYLGPSPAVVRCTADLAPVVSPLLAERNGWRAEIDPSAPPGFQLTAAHGSIVIDRTIPQRLLLEETRLRLEILRELGEP